MPSYHAVTPSIFMMVSIFLLALSGSVFGGSEVGAEEQAKQESELANSIRSSVRHMDKAEAADFEKSLDSNPDDMAVRTKLIGYYFYKGVQLEGAPATIKARRRHITWLIKTNPDSVLAGKTEATIDPSGHDFADKVGYETASAMWRSLVERGDASRQTLHNAYRFLRLHDKREAEKIALKAKDPTLIGEIYALGISRITLMNQNGFVLDVGSSREDMQYAAHAVESLRNTKDRLVIDVAAGVLLFNGAIAQALCQRGGKPLDPLPIAFAGELLEKCDDCYSRKHYYNVMQMISTTPADRQKYAKAELEILEKESAKSPAPQTENDKARELYSLAERAVGAFAAGEHVKAEEYANKILQGVSEHPDKDRFGMVLHKGHIVLGRISLLRGDVKDARRHLLAAADVKGGGTLTSFGPNMALAKELLERGERDVVITYLKRCKRFWPRGQDNLAKWIATIEKGAIPNFGANMVY